MCVIHHYAVSNNWCDWEKIEGGTFALKATVLATLSRHLIQENYITGMWRYCPYYMKPCGQYLRNMIWLILRLEQIWKEMGENSVKRYDAVIKCIISFNRIVFCNYK